jgi:2-dehydro-3-deoxyphosphogluconate aldolase/(4S)-4-hydroxy-2-oxoglutarate aldolase
MSGSSRADIVSVLAGAPVVPVITIERVEDAVPLARALTAGGIRAIEITLRTPAAREAAAAIIKDVPEAVVGIGTVLTPADLSDAERLGALFAASPGCSTALLQAATRSRVPFLPGAQTASEVMACLAHGFDTMKLFPAVPSGGLAMLRALAGPFPSVRFCPTGGIGESNAAEWLAESNVVAVGGSWLAPPSDILKGDWTAISNRAASAKALRRR